MRYFIDTNIFVFLATDPELLFPFYAKQGLELVLNER